MDFRMVFRVLAAATLPTAQGALPADCLALPGEGGALELISLRNCSVYLGIKEGRDDVTEEAFEHWENLEGGWSKNSAGVRYTTFQRSCLYGSPGSDGSTLISIQAGEPWSPPISWMLLANTCGFETSLGGCFPSRCDGLDPPEGGLKYYEINKCHKMVFDQGANVSIITDPDGNKYIMHAASDAQAAKDGVAFNQPQIPAGWEREDGHVLEEEVILTPDPQESASTAPQADAAATFGSTACGFALIQDSQGNAYHRYVTTTGNANIKGQLHLLLRGRTPDQLAGIITTAGIIVAVLLIAGIAYCLLKPGANSNAQSSQAEADAGAELVS